MQIEHDITEELYQWGWWAQLCPSRSLNYPSQATVIPIKLDKSALETLSITDDRALEIDQAIAKLFHGDNEVISIMKLHFVCGFSQRQIARSTGMKREKVKSIIDSSINWLNGYFYKKEEIRLASG